MSKKTNSRLRGIGLAAALLGAFAGGWAVAGTQVATEINTGLLRAFNSVGQNLFGSAVFGVEVPPNPIAPDTPVQLYFADNAAIPVQITIFKPAYPPSPCQPYARLIIDSQGVRLAVDPSVQPTAPPSDDFGPLVSSASEAEVAALEETTMPPVAGCNSTTTIDY